MRIFEIKLFEFHCSECKESQLEERREYAGRTMNFAPPLPKGWSQYVDEIYCPKCKEHNPNEKEKLRRNNTLK